MRFRLVGLAVAVLGIGLGTAVAARAEVVIFASGGSLDVRGHRIDGDRMVLLLRGGGETICDASLVVRIDPDELPDLAIPTGAAPGLSVDGMPFGEFIGQSAAQHGVDPRLILAVIQVESAFRPDARSPKGAVGLMQLMPGTVRRYDLADPFEPSANIDAGVRHLRTLLDRFELPLALAAYNAGEAAVERYQGIPPFPETIGYVRQVLRLARPDANTVNPFR